MIENIEKGDDAFGLARYLLAKKDRNGQIRPRHDLIGGTLTGRNARQLADEIECFHRLRPRLKSYVGHVSLRTPANDRLLKDTEWREIGDRWAKAMGIAAYAIIHHGDHIHLLFSRVNPDGSVVSDSQDYRRGEAAVRRIEKDMGLIQVESSHLLEPKKAVTHRKAPTRTEIAMAERGALPKKYTLQDLLDMALQPRPTVTRFIEILEQFGVVVEPNIAGTGKFSGFAYWFEETRFTSKSLGRGYTLANMQKKGLTYEPDRDLAALHGCRTRTADCSAHAVIATNAPTAESAKPDNPVAAADEYDAKTAAIPADGNRPGDCAEPSADGANGGDSGPSIESSEGESGTLFAEKDAGYGNQSERPHAAADAGILENTAPGPDQADLVDRPREKQGLSPEPAGNEEDGSRSGKPDTEKPRSGNGNRSTGRTTGGLATPDTEMEGDHTHTGDSDHQSDGTLDMVITSHIPTAVPFWSDLFAKQRARSSETKRRIITINSKIDDQMLSWKRQTNLLRVLGKLGFTLQKRGKFIWVWRDGFPLYVLSPDFGMPQSSRYRWRTPDGRSNGDAIDLLHVEMGLTMAQTFYLLNGIPTLGRKPLSIQLPPSFVLPDRLLDKKPSRSVTIITPHGNIVYPQTTSPGVRAQPEEKYLDMVEAAEFGQETAPRKSIGIPVPVVIPAPLPNASPQRDEGAGDEDGKEDDDPWHTMSW